MTIANRIKTRRKELGLSVDDIAHKLGKNRATIYRYESGDIEDMPTSVLLPIAKALGTTPAFLMGWDEEPAKSEEKCSIAPKCKSLDSYIKEIEERQEIRMLLDLAKDASKEDVENTIDILKVLKKKELER